MRISSLPKALAMAGVLVLSACTPDAETASLGQVGIGSSVVPIVDYVGWRDGDGAFHVVFSEKMLAPEIRQAMIESRSATPATEENHLLEMRVEAIGDGSGEKVTAKSAMLTFWNFTEFPVVLSKDSREGDIEALFPNLRGEVKAGGWIAGTSRGTEIMERRGERESVLWNVEFHLGLHEAVAGVRQVSR